MMLEARVTRRVTSQLAAKSDLSDLKTRILKKRKVAPNKSVSSISKPHVSTIPPPEDSCPSSPKKMKNLTSDEVCRSDSKISSLMQRLVVVTKTNHLMNLNFGAITLTDLDSSMTI